MDLRITDHARCRMRLYGIEEQLVRSTIEEPDATIPGHSGRSIAQKVVNEHLLRVIVEGTDPVVVVTVYPARRDRYGV